MIGQGEHAQVVVQTEQAIGFTGFRLHKLHVRMSLFPISAAIACGRRFLCCCLMEVLERRENREAQRVSVKRGKQDKARDSTYT